MFCIVCGQPRRKHAVKYCSFACQKEDIRREYLSAWFRGDVDGFRDSKKALLSKHIRKYVLDKAGHKCEECGWDTKHPTTGVTPLDVHHVDGDSQNNRPENLKALCPNCHSLTVTYKNLNKGNGRKLRYKLAPK